MRKVSSIFTCRIALSNCSPDAAYFPADRDRKPSNANGTGAYGHQGDLLIPPSEFITWPVNHRSSTVQSQATNRAASSALLATCGRCRLSESVSLHEASTDGDFDASEDASWAGCSHRRSPTVVAACCEVCRCLRVLSTTRSCECDWFRNTGCVPGEAQHPS